MHLASSNSLKAQCTSPYPNIEFSIVDTIVAEGSNFCIDIRVTNFQNINYWITPLSFNPNVLRLTSCSIDKNVEYNHPDIGSTFVCDLRAPLNVDGTPAPPPSAAILNRINEQIASGFFNYSSGTFLDDFAIDNSGRFITLCFEVVGDVGDQTKLSVADIPPFAGVGGTQVEIFNREGGGVEVCVDPIIGGNITVGCVSATTSQPTTCPTNPGANTGTIRFTICGGTPPYQYSLDGGPAVTVNNSLEEIIIDGLAAGDYDIDVMDNAGNTILVSNPITVGSGIPLLIDSVLTQGPSCATVNNLNATFINVVTTGGSGNDIYQWSSTGVSVNPLEKVDVGNYSVTVIDGNGCKAIEENIVVEYNALEMDVDVVAPICPSDPAVVTLTVSGGLADGRDRYTYFTRSTPSSPDNIRFGNRPSVWSPPNVFPGEVYFRAEDFSFSDPKCFVDTTFTITAQKNIALELLPTNDGCGSGGVINVNARLEPGSLPLSSNLTYRLFDDTGVEIDVITGADSNINFTGLSEGTYTVQFTDEDDGCMFSEEEDVPPNTGAGLTVNHMANNPGCGRLGNITIEVPGAEPADYRYDWNDVNNTSKVGDNTLTDLSADNYFVTVTNINSGCQGVSQEIRLEDAGTTLDFDDINVIRPGIQEIPCSGTPTGVLSYNIRDANLRAGAIYTWYRDGVEMVGETTSTITALGPGDYRLEITGTDICLSTTSYTLAQPVPIVISVQQQDTVCFGSPIANFSAVVQNGGPNTEITWRDTSTNIEVLPEGNTQIGAPVGTYLVSAFDPDLNCSDEIIFTVEQYDEFNIDFFRQTENECFVDSNAEVEVVVTGGSGDGNVFYTWSTDPTMSIPDLNTQTGLASGPYTVQVFDNDCRSEVIPFEITGGEEIKIDNATSIITTPSCFGVNDGTAEINISGGSGISRTTRLVSADTILIGLNGNTITGIPAGEYTVQLVDDTGCPGTDVLSILEPDIFTIEVDSANLQTLSCKSSDTGIIRIKTPEGGNPGRRTYSWSHDETLDSPTATNLTAREYVVTATDARGCIDSTVYVMEPSTPIEVDFNSIDSVRCFGDRYMFGGISPTGGTNNGFRYSINGNNPRPVMDSILLLPNTHQLTIFDQDGCDLDTTFVIMQPPEVIVELGPDVEIELGDTYQLRAEHDPEENIISYAWNTDQSIDCLDCPTISVTPDADAVYGVEIVNNEGCADDDEVTIRVRRTRNVYIPNVINTSNSNSNSSFKLFSGQGVEQIAYLRIFDRFGNLVHEVEQLSGSALGTADWDARLNGSLIESGVYAYTARILFTDGEFLDYKGDITVIH